MNNNELYIEFEEKANKKTLKKALKKVESLMNINTIHRQIELQKSGCFYDNFNEDI